MSEPCGRLVMVSNRLGREAALGGLALVISEALRTTGGMWFGWDGEAGASPSGQARTIRIAEGIEYVGMTLDEADRKGHYAGDSNAVLWPAFHGQTGLVRHRQADYRAYQRVNMLFARALLSRLRPHDTVWVHDYHLIPLARALRSLGAAQPIGFFLHTPFPTPRSLRAIPEHRCLIAQLNAYDRIGVQTLRDREALERCGVGQGRVRVAGVGIDHAEAGRLARSHAAVDAVTRHLPEDPKRCLIIGIDRADYSKGLDVRLLAFEQLLERRPDLHRRVELLQICAPTRTGVAHYDMLPRRLRLAARRIKRRFGSPDWQPVRMVFEAVPRAVALGLMHHADVGLVTPRRDGMNLVATEFVAAQCLHSPGVLVLSREAGIAERLRSAIRVCPHPRGIADGLERALAMNAEQRKAHHTASLASLSDHTPSAWARQLSTMLRAAAASASDRQALASAS